MVLKGVDSNTHNMCPRCNRAIKYLYTVYSQPVFCILVSVVEWDHLMVGSCLTLSIASFDIGISALSLENSVLQSLLSSRTWWSLVLVYLIGHVIWDCTLVKKMVAAGSLLLLLHLWSTETFLAGSDMFLGFALINPVFVIAQCTMCW
jgi:hypothetical protein